MKRIKTANGETFAHVLGKGTIEIKRQNQRFIVTGTDFQIIGTEPTHTRKTVLAVENGRLLEDDIILEDDDNLTDEERQQMEQQKIESQQQADNIETEEDAVADKKIEIEIKAADGESKKD